MADDPDAGLVERARAGDEAAFTELVRRHSPSMLRVAMTFVPSRAVAEEVVQETWLGVLRGLDRFEGRAQFRTWLFRILTNRAKTRGERERRSVPLASLASAEAAEDGEAAVDPSRFLADGGWASLPQRWDLDPEAAARSADFRRIVDAAIAGLPPAQRTVITLRDLEGLDAETARNALGVSETNQRVLLHRARAKVRKAVEEWIAS